MKYLLPVLSIFLFIPITLISQNNDCACCTPAHEQFDFWVGNWEVFNEKGKKIGENLIEKLEDNCILSENWEGEKGGSGKSFNYYDPADSTWNQLWISNSGNILKLKGEGKPDKMILKSEPVKGEKGNYYNKITWTKNPDGSVTQLWELYDLQGNLLNEAFKGIYRKKD
ncbi:hypothetical protein NE848_08165 [Gramella jeungdoensis]|uniref:DUF1579 domain-containing protein n=1 Tax=Gramella jeungdoensis TaxID=708091 RepID=A0ABT0Z1V3_9FLAO|nr:hypothetical protein [Gramella jeungdoensis]MCM8569350.1 hypothetical protein [Gramella jeungdoensis]